MYSMGSLLSIYYKHNLSVSRAQSAKKEIPFSSRCQCGRSIDAHTDASSQRPRSDLASRSVNSPKRSNFKNSNLIDAIFV